MAKSTTDMHWDKRAEKEQDHTLVNIADTSQRRLETDFILKHVCDSDNVLEVGCGNGYLTNILRNKVKHIDAFDYSENMIKRAIDVVGVKNNYFYHDNIVHPAQLKNNYDAIICVRVLINLSDFEEQKVAFVNMTNALKKGGKLILIEGYMDGFDELNKIRLNAGLAELTPAKINFYSYLGPMKKLVEDYYNVSDSFHTGMYDFLTRVVYPCLVGAKNATQHDDFHGKILPVAETFNPDAFSVMARLHGFALIKK